METNEPTHARSAACRMCHRLLNQPDDPTSADCGGDCLRCLAQAGDPDCAAAMGLTIEGICRLCDVSPAVAERAIENLKRRGLIEEIDNG